MVVSRILEEDVGTVSLHQHVPRSDAYTLFYCSSSLNIISLFHGPYLSIPFFFLFVQAASVCLESLEFSGLLLFLPASY